MRPTHLYARNFRTYPVLDIDFPDGLVGIVGELRNQADGADSNGAGKSSILEAVDIALFGRRSLAPYLTRGVIGEELLLELELEHGGELYRIRRSFKPKKTPTLDFERAMFSTREGFSDDKWVPLTQASAKETQAAIEATVGLSRDTYRNSSYLRQGEGSFADPSLDPRARRNLLAAAVFGHDSVYPHRQQQAREDRARLHEQHLEATGRIRLAQELVDQKPVLVVQRDTAVEAETETADRIADLEREHAVLAERFQEAREHGARRAAAEAELGAAKSSLASIETERSRASVAAEEKRRAVEQLAATVSGEHVDEISARIAVLEAEAVEYDRAAAAHLTVAQQAQTARAQRDALVSRAEEYEVQAAAIHLKKVQLDEATAPTCQTCGQHLPDDAKARAIASYDVELATLVTNSTEARRASDAIVIPDVPSAPEGDGPHADLRATREQIAAIHETAALRERLQERIRNADAAIAAAPDVEERFALAVALVTAKQAALDLLAPADLDEITRQGTAVRERLEAARAARDQQRTLHARLDERLTQIAAAETQLAVATSERATLDGALAVVAELDRIYGPAGIPTLVLENIAIPQIETEANRLLGLLGCPYTVELRTQADKTDGGVKETFDVVVIDEHGEDAPFEECTSGGEKTRIGLALRIALARLLSHRRGAESRILCLDEPSYLDEAGMRALLEVLTGLQTDFDTILLVSHVAELRDSFDTTLHVIRDGAASRVSSGDREPVTA